MRRELAEMEQRVGRLTEELRLAKEARWAKERETAEPTEEARELRASLGSRDAELLKVRDQVTSVERNMRAMREAAAKARAGLEEMLGEATTTGDPRTAERIGTVLKVLSQL
jgi:chromosome segregation ATPase